VRTVCRLLLLFKSRLEAQQELTSTSLHSHHRRLPLKAQHLLVSPMQTAAPTLMMPPQHSFSSSSSSSSSSHNSRLQAQLTWVQIARMKANQGRGRPPLAALARVSSRAAVTKLQVPKVKA